MTMWWSGQTPKMMQSWCPYLYSSPHAQVIHVRSGPMRLKTCRSAQGCAFLGLEKHTQSFEQEMCISQLNSQLTGLQHRPILSF